MMTTDSVYQDPYVLKRDPHVAAKEIDSLDLRVIYKGANKYEVAGETFKTQEEAGEYVRKVRHIAARLAKFFSAVPPPTIPEGTE